MIMLRYEIGSIYFTDSSQAPLLDEKLADGDKGQNVSLEILFDLLKL